MKRWHHSPISADIVGCGRTAPTVANCISFFQSDNALELHIAAHRGDLEAILQCYLNDDDLTARDELGNTALHRAAMNDQRSAARGLMALALPETPWMIKNKEGKTSMDLATIRIRKDMNLISMQTACIVDQHSHYNNQLLEERLAHPNKDHKVLLSIDGGGIKAILIMGTMLAVERELGERLMSRVHWLGGTSCGGIISLVLGGGYTCDAVRKLFLREKMETFCGNTKAFPKHNSAGIEKTLKKYLGEHTKMAEIADHKYVLRGQDYSKRRRGSNPRWLYRVRARLAIAPLRRLH